MNVHEPNYPGTVMMGAHDLVCHRSTERCPTEEPHTIAQCGEFDVPRRDAWLDHCRQIRADYYR